MHTNHKFLIEFASTQKPNGRYLDFGCGAGEALTEGFKQGLDIWGADNFSLSQPPKSPRILRIGEDDRLEFPSEHFDVIVSNMVFEHVMNLPRVLKELKRILKPDGLMLHLWPSKEVLFEGHCRLLLAHRLRSAAYLRFCHRIGLGTWRQGKTREKWASDWLRYFAESCNYLPERDLQDAFEHAGFSFSHAETEYARLRFGFPIPRWLINRLLTMVVISKPKEQESPAIAERSCETGQGSELSSIAGKGADFSRK
jgi:SAM-dependent methyltransferase